MLKNRHLTLLTILLLVYIPSSTFTQEGQNLSDFNFTSASVLPFFTYRNTKYVILAREAHGSSRGTYDDFGGGREENENHPLITATREFFEEAILQLTIGLTIEEAQIYINNTKNIIHIIAYSRHGNKKNITYIIRFDDYKDQLLNNFYTALKQVIEDPYKEKDRIAIVKWNTLKRAMRRSKDTKDVKVKACERHPKTGILNEKYIILRSCFVKKLRPFFLHTHYKRGLNKKMRFFIAKKQKIT
jgi:8-oxo-dGTP pyrophosphatase MutT (NUDIX family)